MRKLLLALLVVSWLSTATGQERNLSLNLEKDKTYNQNTRAKVVVDQELNGQPFSMTMIVEAKMTYRVMSADNSGYQMEVKYDQLGMKMEMPQGTADFSSEYGDSDIFSSVLGAMKNKSFELTMTRSGKIKDVRKIDNVFQSVFDAFPQLSDAQQTQLRTQLEKAYGAEAFKGNIEMVTAIFPE